jgi:hypothetical protein
LSAHVEQAAARGITAEQLERARREQLNAFERLRGDHEAVAALLSQAEVAGDWRLLFWQVKPLLGKLPASKYIVRAQVRGTLARDHILLRKRFGKQLATSIRTQPNNLRQMITLSMI